MATRLEQDVIDAARDGIGRPGADGSTARTTANAYARHWMHSTQNHGRCRCVSTVRPRGQERRVRLSSLRRTAPDAGRCARLVGGC